MRLTGGLDLRILGGEGLEEPKMIPRSIETRFISYRWKHPSSGAGLCPFSSFGMLLYRDLATLMTASEQRSWATNLLLQEFLADLCHTHIDPQQHSWTKTLRETNNTNNKKKYIYNNNNNNTNTNNNNIHIYIYMFKNLGGSIRTIYYKTIQQIDCTRENTGNQQKVG